MEFVLLLIFIITISFGLITLLTVVKGVSRIFVRSDKSQNIYNSNHNKYRKEKSSKAPKIFSSNEGQYIKYEEIKE